MNNITSRIIEILRDNEESLSDGYGYYCGSRVDEVLEGIAEKIASLFTVCDVCGANDWCDTLCLNCGSRRKI